MSILHDPTLDALLAELHNRSEAQLQEMQSFYEHRFQEPQPAPEVIKEYLSDKMVALEQDKAELCYQLIRAKNAKRVVEIGTSYGVSTLYLAAAVRDNVRSSGGSGLVIATEYEPGKAAIARGHFAKGGLSDYIELREGDLRETLQSLDTPIEFMLVDIWVPMARPALELVAPHLAPGAIVLCDNTEQYRTEYADYFAFINDPANAFTTMTLPFRGGLELSVRCGRR